jgi:4-carboxymuconolactone decarboxylase
MAEKVAAEQDILGSFAPKFAELNDDVLFGQIGSGRSGSPAGARS